MKKRILGFTLIELIIVIVIIGILAVVAIPKYFANIKKARKAATVSTLTGIREAMMMYYSTTNAYPAVTGGTPLAVTVDGDVVITAQVPTGYSFANPTITAAAFAASEGSCVYTMNVATGVVTTATASCP